MRDKERGVVWGVNHREIILLYYIILLDYIILLYCIITLYYVIILLHYVCCSPKGKPLEQENTIPIALHIQVLARMMRGIFSPFR